jgi:signal transduction histidine kinase
MTGDIQLGMEAGCKTVLVRTGQGGADQIFKARPDLVVSSLADLDSVIPAPILEQSSQQQGEIQPQMTQMEAIGKLSGKVGHDLNNLLGVMRGSIDLIKSRLSKVFVDAPNPVERQVKLIDGALFKAAALTTKLRGYIRPGPLPLTPAKIKICCEDVLNQLKAAEQSAGVFEFIAAADPTVEIAEFYVSQLILGVCTNALDATATLKDRVLILRLDETELRSNNDYNLAPGRYAQVSVIDHGTGISEDLQAKILAPFNSTKDATIGAGMGLSLAMGAELMRKHGGALDVRSAREQGTRVSLFFPIHT